MRDDSVTFESTVTNGRFEPLVAETIRQLLRRMEGKRLRLKISRWTRQRSDRQNRYYWGVVVEMVWQMFLEYGNDMTKEEVHDFLKGPEVGALFTEVMDPRGEIHRVPLSTTKLTTVSWEDYMTKCRAWAARMGLQIPEPNEVLHG